MTYIENTGIILGRTKVSKAKSLCCFLKPVLLCFIKLIMP